MEQVRVTAWVTELDALLAKLSANADLSPPKVLLERTDCGECHVEFDGVIYHYIGTERGEITDHAVFTTLSDLASRIMGDHCMDAARRMAREAASGEGLDYDRRRVVFPLYIELMERCSAESKAYAVQEIASILAHRPYR